MHDIPALRELLVIASVSLAVVIVFSRLRLPPTIGFIVTGILIGPGGFGLVHDEKFVGALAEIGIILKDGESLPSGDNGGTSASPKAESPAPKAAVSQPAPKSAVAPPPRERR